MSAIGHARERSPGRWEIRYRVSRKLQTATINARSEREALAEIGRRVAAGVALDGSARTTIADYAPVWLVGMEIAPMTRRGYESTMRATILPELGHVRLRELSPSVIRAAFQKWHNAGRTKSGLRQVKIVLQSMVRSALLDDLISSNPFDRLRSRKGQPSALPVAMSPKAVPADLAKIAALLAEPNDRYGVLIVLLAAAGLRRGEACGLRWRNVDLDGGSIRIAEQILPMKGGSIFAPPKSSSGVRSIRLPAEAIDKLREHRAAQRERLFAHGVRVTGETTVAADDVGEPIQPQAFGKWLARRGVGPHSIRHAHLSKLANSGIPIAAVARRAGHADIRVTLQTYIHPDDADDADAAAVASALMG